MVKSGAPSLPSLTGDMCVLDARFIVCKIAAFGHGIAIDSGHGVFLLAAAFSMRRACTDGLLSSVMVHRGTVLLRALISSFCSCVKLSRRALSCSRLC